MARVGRLAGALLAETEGNYFLVGNTKEPCDWKSAGFEPPAVDPSAARYVKLVPLRAITLSSPHLVIGLEGEALAQSLAQRFLVERNGSVSDRLWRLVVNGGVPEEDAPPVAGPAIDAKWLGEMPGPIWKIIRDTVLRCI